MNRRTTRRGLAVASAVVVSSTLLAGCADDLPQPVPGEPFDGPVLSEEQDTAVFDAVAKTVTKADKELKSDALKPRVTGPAFEVRKSQIGVAKDREDGSFITEIPSESQQMIIPTTQGWPRTSYSITTPTEDLGTLRLVAFEQASARDPYKMWSWVQLIPGVVMPAFADAGIGSGSVPAKDESLVASPRDAVAQYADVVALGSKKSSFGKNFELPEGDLTAVVQEGVTNFQDDEDFQAADGKYSVEFTARKDDLRSVRTADGGALVMGVLDGRTSLTVEEEGTVKPYQESQEALLGDVEPTNKLNVRYTDMVALYVPPKGSEEKMRPVGYSHVPTAASN